MHTSFFSFLFIVIDNEILISKADNEDFIYDDFIDLDTLSQSHKGICNVTNNKIEYFRSEGKSPAQTIFKSYDIRLKLDFVSLYWICFYYLPSQIGLSFPFQCWIEFFETTLFSYVEIMPMIWSIIS